jgi:hypothetical protein
MPCCPPAHLQIFQPSCLERTHREVYTRSMLSGTRTRYMAAPPGMVLYVFVILATLSLVIPAAAAADPDIYGVLPSDIRILQYSLADFDGDTIGELAILYTAGGETHITLFRGRQGRWSRWWDDEGAADGQDGNPPRSMETTDTNGDGRAEILLYYLTENNSAMTARILTLENKDTGTPVFEVILEDTTSPPGYPLLGVEEGSYSVTFLRMATEMEDGYRRVYCWEATAFEKCREVVWEKP